MSPRRPTLLALVATVACAAPEAQPDEPLSFEPLPWSAEDIWFKGNTHAHTTDSDGDSPPGYVAQWYKDRGYDFLVLSDHNVFTDPATLAGLVDSTFLLVAGEEVTSSFEEAPVHVNINHPNFGWAFSLEELVKVENDRLLEIYNGHPSVHNHGGGGVLGLEAVWDGLLTGGKRIYGIAVDDAHHFQGEFAPGRSNPGRGWVTVRSPAVYELDSDVGYVRAKVMDSMGYVAWTQPLFVIGG